MFVGAGLTAKWLLKDQRNISICKEYRHEPFCIHDP
jgi:hypothetical protein